MKSFLGYILICSVPALLSLNGNAQEANNEFNQSDGDSLGFEQTVRQVISTHPAVAKAEQAIQMAEAGIGLAQTSRLPEVDATAGYTFLGPLPSITIPDMGTFKMGTPNNINSAVNVREILFDFSRTASKVRLQQSSRDMASAGMDLVKQQLVMATAVCFYSLV